MAGNVRISVSGGNVSRCDRRFGNDFVVTKKERWWGWGGVGGDGKRDVCQAAVYPAISVAKVTSLLPSQTVLNCSGTASSVWRK